MKSKWFHHISSSKNTFPCLSKIIARHQNVTNCQNTLIMHTLRWRIFLQNVWMGQICMTDAGTIQDNYILPATPVGGLPYAIQIHDIHAHIYKKYKIHIVSTYSRRRFGVGLMIKGPYYYFLTPNIKFVFNDTTRKERKEIFYLTTH